VLSINFLPAGINNISPLITDYTACIISTVRF